MDRRSSTVRHRKLIDKLASPASVVQEMKASSSNRTVDANKLSFDEHRGNNKAQKEFQPVLFVCSGALILLIISAMCITETQGFAVGRPVDDRGLPPYSTASALLDTKIVKVGDSSLLPLSSPNDAMEIRLLSSPLPTTAEKKKGKGRRHRRHNRRNHKSQTGLQRWKMIAGMSSLSLSQLDYEIYLLAEIIETHGIPIPTSSLLHPSSTSLLQQPNDITSAEEFNNLNCCPSYQFTYKLVVGVDINRQAVFLAGYGEDSNSSAIQTFNGVNCFPHVVNKPCRFLFQLHPDAVCAQKYSYTRALLNNAKGDESGPDNSGATADIRVPSGCQCEIPI